LVSGLNFFEKKHLYINAHCVIVISQGILKNRKKEVRTMSKKLEIEIEVSTRPDYDKKIMQLMMYAETLKNLI
jgi:hypothetical protein